MLIKAVLHILTGLIKILASILNFESLTAAVLTLSKNLIGKNYDYS